MPRPIRLEDLPATDPAGPAHDTVTVGWIVKSRGARAPEGLRIVPAPKTQDRTDSARHGRPLPDSRTWTLTTAPETASD